MIFVIVKRAALPEPLTHGVTTKEIFLSEYEPVFPPEPPTIETVPFLAAKPVLAPKQTKSKESVMQVSPWKDEADVTEGLDYPET